MLNGAFYYDYFVYSCCIDLTVGARGPTHLSRCMIELVLDRPIGGLNLCMVVTGLEVNIGLRNNLCDP